jgi:hypothetical protein
MLLDGATDETRDGRSADPKLLPRKAYGENGHLDAITDARRLPV